MRKFGEFVKTASTTGLLVLFPLVACIYIIIVVLGFLTGLVKPLLVNLVPESRFLGVVLADAASIILILASCFVVGVVAGTAMGGAFFLRLSRVLNAVPGYRIFLRIATIIFDPEDASGTPVVVQRGDSRQIGFLMDDLGNGEMVVFFPEAPSLFSGSVEIVAASTVERLNVPAFNVARVIATYGAGTHTLLTDHVNKTTQS